MKRWLCPFALGVLCLLSGPAMTLAGMLAPLDGDIVEGVISPGLHKTAEARLQNLSFFLLGFLLSAFFIQLLWNWVRKDWTFLPRLTYGKALGVVFLWGLLFALVLTMISGARELMTPGAWEKQGLTYRLPKAPTNSGETDTGDNKREKQLSQLRDALWKYAQLHQGQFPADLGALAIPNELRQTPDASGMSYLYVQGLKVGQSEAPLVFEPDIFGPERLVLFTNGMIRGMKSSELQQLLTGGAP